VAASRAATPVAEPLFHDRHDAGRRLAAALHRFRDQRPVVIALPHGGVPVAYEVARALDAPLDVLAVRKLGAPLQPEYAIGAIAEEGVGAIDRRAFEGLGVTELEVRAAARREAHELARAIRAFHGAREPISVRGRTVLVVDDGLATGSTAFAAAQALRKRGAARVVLAVPVAPPGTSDRLEGAFDEVVCLHEPEKFLAVGSWYQDFTQTSDEQVQALLRAHAEGHASAPPAESGAGRRHGGLDWSRLERRAVSIPASPVRLAGDLRLPPEPIGLVIFAHGSGSSRLSPRGIQVATALGASGLATLLIDLLDEQELTGRHNLFDVGLLADRLVAATACALSREELRALPLGYFGASTGAAAALSAAAELGERVRAIVCRGGRPDLASAQLSEVTAPTLLIVGGDDWNVLALNEEAISELRCPHELAIVPHAGHLFEEPGALERVTELGAEWFGAHLTQAAGRDAA
jgi:putative phosphoribosyl transferase